MKKGDMIKWIQRNGNILETVIVRVNKLSYTCQVINQKNYIGTIKVFKDWAEDNNGEKVVFVAN